MSSRPIRAAVLATLATLSLSAHAQDTRTVLISFDGGSLNPQWERSLQLGRDTGARFTYFVSCVMLLANDKRDNYVAPDGRRGTSNVGFGGSKEEVAARLRHVWQAHLEGHEIASHGCGHFEGAKWSEADWKHEFTQFHRILRDAWTINGIGGEPDGWKDFADKAVTGFRAPYLATGPGLYRALVAEGVTYDASAVSRGPAAPEAARGLTRFALPLIPEGPSGRPVIAMDYNLFFRHTRAKETVDEGGVFEKRSLEAFRNAYRGPGVASGIPLQIGFHFTLMNDGAYWRALERFADETCKQAETACTTYSAFLKASDSSAVASPAY